ncbi:WG repeat-containing protein [Paractinoplanes maris]|uniref:WG repeat-containing protein n=1 Tax=Paractinoplanes maris TaxID=1734446 RepID=UPI0020218858|nr:WG repeat-containing protein [Actinoplanes maris]
MSGDDGYGPDGRVSSDGADFGYGDDDAIEVELIEFEPVIVPAGGAFDEDDIVDAELIEDPVAELEAPSAPHALTAGPLAPSQEGIKKVDWEQDAEIVEDSEPTIEGSTPDAVTAEGLEPIAGERPAYVVAPADGLGADAVDEPAAVTTPAEARDTEADPANQPPAVTTPAEAHEAEADPVDQPAAAATPAEAREAEANPVDRPAAVTSPAGTRDAEADAADEPADIAATAEAREADVAAPAESDVAPVEGDVEDGTRDGGADGGHGAARDESADAGDGGGGSGGSTGSVGGDSPSYEKEAQPIRQQREQRADPRNRRTDPEQILAAYPVTFDPRTLREQIEDDEPMWVVIDRLTDKLEYAERDADRARLLSLRAVASRLLRDLDPALEDANAALVHAEAAGDLARTATVRARLAHVLQWRGDYAAADRVYAEADSAELPARLRAEIRELAGRSAFEQGRYLEAVNHLEGALDLRKGADPDLVERIELALDTITGRASDGWGPYPRSADEILGRPKPARPLRDESSGLFGYPDLLPARFAQAQPFADGVAWVRRPEAPAWELIDESGALLIDASSGYRAAGRFAEGLAWVSRDDAGGWHAVDKQNRVIVPGGFEDARPFHNGLALVRRGGWGVVDEHTRIVVQPHYHAFATMLASGEPVDGFTEEGLAVVDAGEVYGVVDRTGQLLVPPVHAALLIHPAAFLVADKFGLWGALDRRGEPLVELKYRERADVLDEIDKLIKDNRPVL